MKSYLYQKLKEGRLNKGLKQSDVTKLLGIKNTTLSNYENGITEPDMDTFLKLCQLYDLDYAVLLSEAYGYPLSAHFAEIEESSMDLIKKYISLDADSRETVTYILDREVKNTNARAQMNQMNRLLAYQKALREMKTEKKQPK